jgi:hypothetical protein
VIEIAIAWKALPVSERMDSLERRLSEIEPLVTEALAQVRLARQGQKLPQYLRQRLASLEYELSNALPRIRSKVKSVREAIPKDALEAERKRLPQVELEL